MDPPCKPYDFSCLKEEAVPISCLATAEGKMREMVAARTHHHFIVRCRIKRLAELAKAQLQEANCWALVCGQEDDNVFHAHSEQVHSQGRDGT